MARLGSRAAVATVALLFGLGWAPAYASADGGHHGHHGHHGKKHQDPDSLPNNFPHRNEGGFGATFSTQGFVSLIGEYFQAQGTNGRNAGRAISRRRRGPSPPGPCDGCSARRMGSTPSSTRSTPTT